MHSPVYVTGIGVVSALGLDVEHNFKALVAKKSGLGPIEILQTRHKSDFKVGEVKLTNQQLFEYAGLHNTERNNFTRTGLLALIAAKEAVINSGIDCNDHEFKTGLISGTTVGGMDRTELEWKTKDSNLDFLRTHSNGNATNAICRQLGIKGYRTTISTACSTGINAIIHGIKLIQQGFLDRAIVGGADALSKFTLNGFNSLLILDHDYCKPFDENRQGLNLGEGAGFLVIESEKSAGARSKKPYCKITGYANANDAYHQTASSPEGEGAYRAMKTALEMSGLLPENIDYINAHGTGTPNNDLSESVAIKRVFTDKVPSFSSTKAYTGHCLGAAAGIESVFSVLSIQHGVIYPNLNYQTNISEICLPPQVKLERKEVINVLSNSFGFGGNNSSIIFSK